MELPVNNEWSYEKLKDTPCRYAGEISDSLVICAHDYNSHFGRISRLIKNDKLIITDTKGEKHWYNVELIVNLKGTDIDAMVNNPYALTLFTCTPDGKMRVVVRCMAIDFESPIYHGYAITQGQINGNVLLIQKYLNIIRSIQPDIPKLTEDSSFGPATYKAVQIFQKSYELDIDGSVGPITWDKIIEVYSNLH